MTEFEEIYKTYFNDVYLYILSLSRDDKLAEDITSDAFFKAMNRIQDFRGDCSVRVWLCQIAKNCYFNYLKRSGKHVSLETIHESYPPYFDQDLEEKIMQQSQLLDLHDILHKLPEPYKEVFSLRVFSELSFRQIGQIFKKSENWACVTYHRARNKIIQKMEDQNREE